MKKLIFIGAFILLCLCGCATNQKDLSNSSDEQLESVIISNLKKIEEVTDLTSSNPYNYTKNEYYKNIVAL